MQIDVVSMARELVPERVAWNSGGNVVKLQWAFGSTCPEVIARIAEADHPKAGNDKHTPGADGEPGIRGREIEHARECNLGPNAWTVDSVITPR